MGLFDWSDHLEIKPLKLTAEHFPLPCSLRKLVLERYADPGLNASSTDTMDQQELIAYLRNTANIDLTPMESILDQARPNGVSALPTADQVAILNWIGAAYSEWERHFALDETLAAELRRLKPLAAALAITDPDCLIPGAHPLHQLLDTVQLSAIGWQSRLGRAGQALEKQISDAVHTALTWFDVDGIDLADICAQIAFTSERDQVRAGRMTQRMIETEQGRIKSANAKREAATMINAALEKCPLPAEIGEFLKGPWFDSAQLVLLKFGKDSQEWQQFSKTTLTLVDSLNSADSVDNSRRQHVFEVITQLPQELKHWLLSLQHDSELADDAVQAVELAHAHVLRRTMPDTTQTEPISLADTGLLDEQDHQTLDIIGEGQWFHLDRGDEDSLRIRLVLRMEDQQQLLFANQAGVKALELSFGEFATFLRDGSLSPLDSGASFSRSLANCAGIATEEELEAFIRATADQARQEEEQKLRIERERLQQEREDAERLQGEREEAERLQREREEAERLQREREEAERLQREREEAERLQQEREEAERLQREREEAERLQQEREEAERLQREREEAERLQQEREEAERLQREREEAERLQQEREEAERLQREREEAERLQHERQEVERLQQAGEETSAIAQAPPSQPAELDVAMGAWLGFHDGDTPLMARLAVHDREEDTYTFVNRSGIKMRQLSRTQLLELMDKGLVDILEARSSFKETVTRMRDQTEDQ